MIDVLIVGDDSEPRKLEILKLLRDQGFDAGLCVDSWPCAPPMSKIVEDVLMQIPMTIPVRISPLLINWKPWRMSKRRFTKKLFDSVKAKSRRKMRRESRRRNR